MNTCRIYKPRREGCVCLVWISWYWSPEIDTVLQEVKEERMKIARIQKCNSFMCVSWHYQFLSVMGPTHGTICVVIITSFTAPV